MADPQAATQTPLRNIQVGTVETIAARHAVLAACSASCAAES